MPHRMKALQKLLSSLQMQRHYIYASFFGTLVSTEFEKLFPDILASSYISKLIAIVSRFIDNGSQFSIQ